MQNLKKERLTTTDQWIHFICCLVLVQLRTTGNHPITEKLSKGCKAPTQIRLLINLPLIALSEPAKPVSVAEQKIGVTGTKLGVGGGGGGEGFLLIVVNFWKVQSWLNPFFKSLTS